MGKHSDNKKILIKKKKNKNNISDEMSKDNSKKKSFKKKFIKLIIFVFLILLIYLGIIGYKWVSTAKSMMGNINSTIVDSQNNTLAVIGSERIHQNVDISNIPNNLKNAYISIEDKRFYKHHGVDVRRTTAAVFSYVFHGGSSSFGGSTITQQLVKNITGDNSNSITRKVKEWVKAFELELGTSKEEILQTYLNIIYVGPNIYGVEMGSKYYFNKPCSELSLAECAFLAGINNTPNSYNPFGENDNSEKIQKRTKTVLQLMLEFKYINQDEYDLAVSEVDSGLKFNKGNVSTSTSAIYSYHTDSVISEVISDICKKKNMSYEFAMNYLYMAGLNIHSTQNSNIQTTMEKEFEKSKHVIKNNDEPSQASMVILDHSTGYVVGCVGGLGPKTTVRGFNRATQSLRQNGSAGKPLSVLAPALDQKIITSASIFDDTQSNFVNINGDPYSPRDNDNNYLGNITVRRAIESSQNIPFVRIIEKLTPKTSMKYLKKMGITSLTDKDNNLSLALGGLDKGVSNLQMAAAYGTIANDGIYIEPIFYTNITDSNGKIILKQKQKKTRVFSKSVAFILKDLLKQPVQGSHGTATNCAISGMDVSAKTGTTDNNYDKWLCGFTPYYTAVTWYGYDSNASIHFNGHNPASVIWSAVMNPIHKNLESKKFDMPKDIESAAICPTTGLLATSKCPNAYTEHFIKGTMPTQPCSAHSNSGTKSGSNTKSNSTVNSSSNTNSASSGNTTNTVSSNNTISPETKPNNTSSSTITNTTKNENVNSIPNNSNNNASNNVIHNTTTSNSTSQTNTTTNTTTSNTNSVSNSNTSSSANTDSISSDITN